MKKLVCLCLLPVILNLAGCATPGPGKGAKLVANEIVAVRTIEGAVELRMKGEFTTSFTIYKPSDPYTVVVELPGVGKGRIRENIFSDKGGILGVKFTEVQTPMQLLRVELLLEHPSDIEPRKLKNSLLLAVVGRGVEAGRAGAEEVSEIAAPAPSEDLTAAPDVEFPPAAMITGLDFSYFKGSLRFTVKGDGFMEPEIFTLDNRIIIDVPGVEMKVAVPDKVVSPVKAVRHGIYEKKVRLVLDIEDEVEFVASTVGDTIVISMPIEERAAREEDEAFLEPDGPGEARALEEAMAEEEFMGEEEAFEEEEEEVLKKRYTGKEISLDFQDAEVVPIFRFLGDIGGFNVVIHPSVKGKITLKLMNVPWDHALDIILEISNLDKSVEDNILRIAPLDVFAKQKEEVARLKGVRIKAAELVQRAIHLKHIDARNMETRLKEAKAMSPRGTVRIDERTNTLILNDVEENLTRIIAEEVPYWDTAEHGTMQVLIEAKIVEINTEYSRTLGIRWGASATDANFSFIDDASTYDFSVNTPVLSAGPGAAVAGGLISVGYTETVHVNMALQALETVSRVKKLANPRVITIDKQPANIKQGVQIPFSTTSAEGTKTEFQEATLSLDVTPEIQPNGMLKLIVKAKNDTQVPVGNEIGINKQEVNTQALVKDGQTLVLGGIYTNTETENETRVPLLGRIPFLGWLFKSRTTTNAPKELLIFITPTIVR